MVRVRHPPDRGHERAAHADARQQRLQNHLVIPHRIAVISDTHLPRGARQIPRECLDALAAADLILHAGDIATAEVLAVLRELGPLEAVHGNVDDAELRTTLPERRVVEVAGARVGIVHDPGRAVGRAERLVDAFAGCDAVIYGHTHMPELTRHRGIWIVNPGSPTERRRAPRRTFALLDVEDGRVRPRLVELP